MLHDLTFALRGLRRRPVYAIVAVSILAVGLSASIAVFTYVNGFYQPFPGVNADGLVRLFGVEDESAAGSAPMTTGPARCRWRCCRIPGGGVASMVTLM